MAQNDKAVIMYKVQLPVRMHESWNPSSDGGYLLFMPDVPDSQTALRVDHEGTRIKRIDQRILNEANERLHAY